MRNLFILCVLCATAWSACKKERLRKDKEILVGTWEWRFSTYPEVGNNPSAWNHNPSNTGASYHIKFLKKGYVIFYKNGEEVARKKTCFSSFEKSAACSECYIFDLDLNGNSKNRRVGTVYIRSVDTLRISMFPFETYQTYPHNMTVGYNNFFIRIE